MLPFHLIPVETINYKNLAEQIALKETSCKDYEDVKRQNKESLYEKIISLPYGETLTSDNKINAECLEKYLDKKYYESNEAQKHKEVVIDDIYKNWDRMSKANEFHAILATNSIAEALQYYRMFKKKIQEENSTPKNSNVARLEKITCIYDKLDTDESWDDTKKNDKNEGLKEIINDYNQEYQTNFSFDDFIRFKKDVANRLGHRMNYSIKPNDEKRIDLVIVVKQLLTGYDSKWINTLYLDKMLDKENLIQAFSRTNRLYKKAKKDFGMIKYFRNPHTMMFKIEEAVKLYGIEEEYNVFIPKLEKNIDKINESWSNLQTALNNQGLKFGSSLPEDKESKNHLLKQYSEIMKTVNTAEIQGLKLGEENEIYDFINSKTINKHCNLDKDSFEIIKRTVNDYKEKRAREENDSDYLILEDVYYNPHELENQKIDKDYLNQLFKNFYINSQDNTQKDEKYYKLKNNLHDKINTLNEENRTIAEIIIIKVEKGESLDNPEKDFIDQINDYKVQIQEKAYTYFSNEVSGIPIEELKKFNLENLNKDNKWINISQNSAYKTKHKLWLNKRNESCKDFKILVSLKRYFEEFLRNPVEFYKKYSEEK